MLRWLARKLGHALARYLEYPVRHYNAVAVTDINIMKQLLQPGDVLLVEGNLRISSAIKYLTQSTWSHSAIYVGSLGTKKYMLIEADMTEGIRAVPVDVYASFNTRICRPVGLAPDDRRKVVSYMVNRLGHEYDLDNIFDLVRYLLPNPPVPTAWRRGLLALGSGEPTKAICSTVIAQAFQSIDYPILPRLRDALVCDLETHHCEPRAVMQRRHHSLYVPRDFDVSPYFNIVKPTLEIGFDYRAALWSDH